MDLCTCRVCKKEKEVTEFSVHTRRNKAKKALVCKQCLAEYAKQYRQKNIDKVRGNERRSKMKRLYGVSLEEYNAMLVAQGHRCGICGGTKPGVRIKYFSVDHCHTTGKVRGLLCERCNRGVGHFSDNVGHLRRAIKYLKGTK